jgi:hypothetical protein
MNIGNHTLRTGLAAALLLAAVTTAAHGFAPGGMSPFGGGSRGMTLIKGNVLCSGCELTEVRKAQPGLPHLYQLTHRQGQVVLQVKTINGSGLWEAPQSPLFAVRAKDEVFRQLTAEENLTKEVEIAGIIRSTRTLDIATVTVSQ